MVDNKQPAPHSRKKTGVRARGIAAIHPARFHPPAAWGGARWPEGGGPSIHCNAWLRWCLVTSPDVTDGKSRLWPTPPHFMPAACRRRRRRRRCVAAEPACARVPLPGRPQDLLLPADRMGQVLGPLHADDRQGRRVGRCALLRSRLPWLHSVLCLSAAERAIYAPHVAPCVSTGTQSPAWVGDSTDFRAPQTSRMCFQPSAPRYTARWKRSFSPGHWPSGASSRQRRG
jgi:hypothetical protein